ncbi:MAG: translesion DNA synthesis-associated protein ImuA [Gammaproteobacteria bacterium]|uniref:translesion DNA synthesis-associated protein ImuA n=1 Tax=uncultured Pseudacidovorax sp. TaxID=679313 RepID=UPI0025F69906|nr:translesion DNA synthesis-associated protein ImuA [uncultured Pseudacidovorax sp.]
MFVTLQTPPCSSAAPARFGAVPCWTPEANPTETGIWWASDLPTAAGGTVATGWASLDTLLPGAGWPTGCAVEILSTHPAVAEWRLLSPALRGSVDGARPVAVVGPPREPHAPGIRQMGIDPGGLIWIDAAAPAQRLWACEQLLRANGTAAVIAWLPQVRAAQIRRLQVLASQAEGLLFLVRPLDAATQASAAPLRVAVSPSRRSAQALTLRVLKRRGPPSEDQIELSSTPPGLQHVFTHPVPAGVPVRPAKDEDAGAHLARPAAASVARSFVQH